MPQLRMRESTSAALWRRLACAAVIALFLCCQGGVHVRVRVTGRPADASTLVVTAALNGVSALGTGQSLTRTPDSFNVQIQDAMYGQLRLLLSAQDAQGCEVAAGEGTLELTGPGTYELDVTLTPQQGCTLQVELVGPAAGSVTSSPPGISCGTKCKQVFGKDLAVLLTPATSARFGGWFADASAGNCVGRVGCTVSIGSGLTRVRANFIHPESCTPSGWCIEEDLPAAPAKSNLYALWGSGRDDVWAVGDAGTLLHGDGILWTETSPVTTRALRGVWGSGPSDVWAVGESGAVLRWNGKTWSAMKAPTQSWLNGIWGSGRSNIWAVGDTGTILRWDGSAWSVVESGTSFSLRSVWGSDPNDVWAVGDSGTVLHWNGAAWAPVSQTSTGAHLADVWGTGASNIWIVGDNGVILLWNGFSLSREPSGTTASLRAVWGTGVSQVWTVGVSGVMRLWNGAAWSPVEIQQPQSLFADIWGSGPRDVWTVGQGLRILRYRP